MNQEGQQQQTQAQNEQTAPLNEMSMVESKVYTEEEKNSQKQIQQIQKIKLPVRNNSMNTSENKSQSSNQNSPNVHSNNRVYTPQYESGMKKSFYSPNAAGKKQSHYSPQHNSTFKSLTLGDEKLFRSSIFANSPANFMQSSMTGSNFYSASSLRHSTTSVSFTKAERFHTFKSAHSGAQYDLPSLRETKSTTFGYGEKRFLPQHLVKNAQEIPSPSKYSNHRSFSNIPTAKSFGIGFKYYAKTYIPNVSIKEPEACRDLPGVGTYDIAEKFADNKLKFSLYGKGTVFQDMNPGCAPPCNQYTPSERLVKSTRYADRSMGFGQKYDFTKCTNANPGPGSYVMPSAFDKFKNNKFNRRIAKSVSHKAITTQNQNV